MKRTQRGFNIYHEGKDANDNEYAIVESSGVKAGIWIQPDANLLFTPSGLVKLAGILIAAALRKALT